MGRLRALWRAVGGGDRGAVMLLVLVTVVLVLPFGSLLLLLRWPRVRALGRSLRAALAG